MILSKKGSGFPVSTCRPSAGGGDIDFEEEEGKVLLAAADKLFMLSVGFLRRGCCCSGEAKELESEC